MSGGLMVYLISGGQGVKIEPTILESLKHKNDSLLKILNEFTALCNSRNVKLYCFFELKKTNLGKIVGVDFPTVSHE